MKLLVECGGIRIFACVQENWQKGQKKKKKKMAKRQKKNRKISIFGALPWQRYEQNLKTDISFENKKPRRIHLKKF